MVFSYSTIRVNNHNFRVVVEADDLSRVGQFKCECGAYIKKQQNLEKHLATPSHAKRLEWVVGKFPPYLGKLLPKEH